MDNGSFSHFSAFTDGAARGRNGLGPASSAFVVYKQGLWHACGARVIGIATNNVAEYTALIHLLEWCELEGVTEIDIKSDSELMVRQINRIYAVRDEKMIPLFFRANQLLDKLNSWTLKHVLRGLNKEADALCNVVLDEFQRTK